MLVPILYNVYLNDLFLRNSDLHDFADGNTITATCKNININDLLCTLDKEAERTSN